jgi:hypothetical protein
MIEKPEQFLGNISLAADSPPKGFVIIESGEPGISKSDIRSFVKVMNDNGIPCQSEEIPAPGISASSNYETVLKKRD